MARPPALSGEREAEARALLASGTSAREVARRFGVDHKTVTKLGRTSPAPSPTGSQSEADAFEAQQLALIERLDAQIHGIDDDGEPVFVSARDLAGLVKAKNDTIKAIRANRAMSRVHSPEEEDGISGLVVAKLQRLAEVGRSVAPVAPAVESEPEKNGTDHNK